MKNGASGARVISLIPSLADDFNWRFSAESAVQKLIGHDYRKTSSTLAEPAGV